MIVLKKFVMKWAPKQSLGEKWSMTSKRLRSTGQKHLILLVQEEKMLFYEASKDNGQLFGNN